MTNVVLKQEYKKQYTSYYSTGVSNALLVGEIIGQITIGLTCDYLGRKTAIILTTMMIVVGGILATASSGHTIEGMFWMSVSLNRMLSLLANRSKAYYLPWYCWIRYWRRVSCEQHKRVRGCKRTHPQPARADLHSRY